MSTDLKSADTHFAFGKNWASYAEQIGEAELGRAVDGLRRLLGDTDLTGRGFLDIGCGSGIHSVAALRLGASHVVAVDIDADSVATTKAVLARYAPGASVRVERRSVFDLNAADLGAFGVVYSWGVLHHTGDMMAALKAAAGMVAPGGVFLFALYRRTYLCSLWRVEKKWYASASAGSQRVAQQAYIAWYRALTTARRLARGQRSNGTAERARGMEFRHDVHDWLGGFPYESILPDEVAQLMSASGLHEVAAILCAPTRGRTHGLLGSGCDEYRYVR